MIRNLISLYTLVLCTFLVAESAGSKKPSCNGYFFQPFSSYPSVTRPFHTCGRSFSSSKCASSCIKKASNCSSFVIDYRRRACYKISNSASSASTFNTSRHSYLQCTSATCYGCSGFIFQPNASIQSNSSTTRSQEKESGLCAVAAMASPGSAFAMALNNNTCKIIKKKWAITASKTSNAYLPCNTSGLRSPPPRPPPRPPSPPPKSPPPPPRRPPPRRPPPRRRPPRAPPRRYPPISPNNVSCVGQPDGKYLNTKLSPPCTNYYVCGGDSVLLQSSCPSPLIWGTNLNACDVPGVAICGSTRAPPPSTPQGSRYTTGLDTSATSAALRAGTQKHVNKVSRYLSLQTKRVPKRADWSSLFGKNVRDQKSCNGSWAYSVVDAIQAAQMIALGLTAKKYTDGPLSVDQLLSCSGSLSTCRGGWPENALEYAASIGTLLLEPEWAASRSCSNFSTIGALFDSPIISWERIPASDPIALKRAVANQPVVVGISSNVFQKQWNQGQSCADQKVDHAVLVVGYTSEFWIIRNSWGSTWGNNGYFKVKMTAGKGTGTCNILAISPMYPVSSPSPTLDDSPGEQTSSLRRQAVEVQYYDWTEADERRQLAVTCNDYYFQQNAMYSYTPAPFFSCGTAMSSTSCATQCIQNAPGCASFVLDTKANRCHVIVDYIITYNASFQAYLPCFNSSCTYCLGYIFRPGSLISPLTAVKTVLPYRESQCADFCQNSSLCTAFSQSLTSNSCTVIFDSGRATASASFNGYLTCALGSAVPFDATAGLDLYCPSMAALCGGGRCVPDSSASGGYSCQCPAGMVAAPDSTGLETCVTVNVCTGGTFNPCNVGVCTNDGKGGYSCQCPPEFTLLENVLGLATCSSAVQYDLTGDGYYLPTDLNQDCTFVSSVTGLGVQTLAVMNQMSSCSQYGGAQVIVGPTTDSSVSQCGMLYQLSSQTDSCATVIKTFSLQPEQFVSLNPSICPKGNRASCVCKSRTPVCVERGQRTALGYPCSEYDSVQAADSCTKIRARNRMMAAFPFFMLNPGIDCDNIIEDDLVCVAPYSPDYFTPEARRKLLITCRCKYGCFLVKPGNTCINLANTYYRCSLKLLQYWNGLATRGFVCVDKNLIPYRTFLCYPQYPGRC